MELISRPNFCTKKCNSRCSGINTGDWIHLFVTGSLTENKNPVFSRGVLLF